MCLLFGVFSVVVNVRDSGIADPDADPSRMAVHFAAVFFQAKPTEIFAKLSLRSVVSSALPVVVDFPRWYPPVADFSAVVYPHFWSTFFVVEKLFSSLAWVEDKLGLQKLFQGPVFARRPLLGLHEHRLGLFLPPIDLRERIVVAQKSDERVGDLRSSVSRIIRQTCQFVNCTIDEEISVSDAHAPPMHFALDK